MTKLISQRDERGVTVVEAAVALVIVIGAIGVAFDFGVGIYNYGLMTHTTAHVARQDAVSFANLINPKCDELQATAEAQARDYLTSKLGAVGKFDFDAKLCASSQPCPDADPHLGPPVLRLAGNWQLDCFFCQFLKSGLTVVSSSEYVVENPRFDCF